MSATAGSPSKKRGMELNELLERIRIKYNPPRELFTLALPVAVAILIVLAAFLMGYTLHWTIKQTPTTNAEEPSAPSMGLDEVMVIALIIAILPYAIDVTLQKRAIRKKEELYTEFLFKLSELMRGGLDPVKAVKELSKTDLGVLTPHVRIASTSMTFGKSFEEAMKAMAYSLHSELITRYTLLVIQASYSGGAVADLILKASEDMRSIISIEREKEGNLNQYVMIFYFAQGIIIFIVYTLTTSLLPFVEQMSSSSFFGKSDIGDIDFARGFFHMIILNSIFGGLIIGKISEGETKYGLKHVVVLVTAGLIASALLILPTPVTETATQPQINITVFSGSGQIGFSGQPLQNSIVFRVTDANGKPVSQQDIEFNITPSGSVTPKKATSDTFGFVKVLPVMGPAAGDYRIAAKAGNATATVPIIVSSSGSDGGD